MLRVLNEFRLGGDGLPGRKLAKAMAGARAKAQIVARHGQLPAVKVAGTDLTRPGADQDQDAGVPRPVVVVRLDATLIEAASPKNGAAGNYKGGFGFHPLTASCSNVGDSLAVMLRPGNAGSFTASDHIVVLDAAIAQIPAQWRTDVLVTTDGAGASHDVINHLTALNTAAAHGKRGRRIEYSIGWPIDERTQAGIDQLRESDWTDALSADAKADPNASVADLTGILRHGPGGDALAGWPVDQRIIARRVPRPAGEQAKPGLEEQFEGIPGALGGIERTFEPGPGSPDGFRTPDEFLDWLSGWVALSLRADVPPERQRLLIANAVPLYRIRGTKAGLEKLVSLYTTLGCTVLEAGPRLQIGVHSTIGEDTSINGGPPHYFRLTVRLATTEPAEIAAQRQILTSIIDAEKPAHTYFDLEIVTPVLQIGVTSHVGVDTLLDGER